MKSKVNEFIAYILIFSFFAILLNNCFYGFGWTDEALYLSILNSKFQGNELFFEICEPTKFYAQFLMTIYSLILIFKNNTENNYFVFRIITIAFQFLLYLTILYIFSRKLERNVILIMISILTILFFTRVYLRSFYYKICQYFYMLAISKKDSIYQFDLKDRDWTDICNKFMELCK